MRGRNRHPRHRDRRLVLVIVAALAVAGCGGDGNSGGDGGSGSRAGSPTSHPATGGTPTVDPANFVAAIDNPYMPLVPGTRFRYKGTSDEGPETDIVTVTHQTRTILGVSAVVVRDTVTRGGELVEDTRDWYAQDRDGNVWYFGEDTKEYENGRVSSTEGSWEAGKDGAEAGIVMQANPRVGQEYRQEYYKGHAEDRAQVLSLDEHVSVPVGSFDHVLKTKDFTPLEPDLVENKYYARGIGTVLETTVSGGSDRSELVQVTRPGAQG